MTRDENRYHLYSVRARYADTDSMGIVYHGRYFEWFEAARTEYLRSMGLPYKRIEEEGISLPVVEAYCRYRRPVVYDELIRVKTVLGEISRSRIRLEYEVLGEEDDIIKVEGYTIHCYVDRSLKPIRASQKLLDFLNTL